MQESCYRSPNLPIKRFREMSMDKAHDPLKAFSEACRAELKSLQKYGI